MPSKEMAQKAISADKNYASAYVNSANAKEMMRDMEGACDDWHKAADLGEQLGQNYFSGNCQ